MGGKRKEWEAKHYHNKEKFAAYIITFLLHQADINFDFLFFFIYILSYVHYGTSEYCGKLKNRFGKTIIFTLIIGNSLSNLISQYQIKFDFSVSNQI